MLEIDSGPQKIAKGALMRRDIWEWLQVRWLHAWEILQIHCQLKCIPVLWMRVVHEDKSVGTMGPCVEVLVKFKRKVDGPLVPCSTRQLLAFLSPGLVLQTSKSGPMFWLCSARKSPLSDRRVSACESQEPKLR